MYKYSQTLPTYLFMEKKKYRDALFANDIPTLYLKIFTYLN